MIAFSPYGLGAVLYGNLWPNIEFGRVLELKKIAETVGALCPNPSRYSETRSASMNRGYRLHCELLSLLSQGLVSPSEFPVLYRVLNEETSLSIAEKTFFAAISTLADESQKEKWGNLAKRQAIIGCFAMNEVGNGNQVETRAVLDWEKREFVLKSPTAASVKWLIGAAGKSATHAVLFAQGFLPDESPIGLHAFLTPLRDPVTLDPLPGVEIGDIGTKLGANYIDNGFIRLTNVRVPMENLLAAQGRISPDGKYVQAARRSPLIPLQVGMRVHVLSQCWYHVARAVTIAVRYSDHRRQFRTYATEPTRERRVIDYQLQSFRLIPLLGMTVAMNVGSGAIRKLMERTKGDSGDMDKVVRCLTAGLKSVYTSTSAELSEVCRECCGGHGFSSFSGLPAAHRDFLACLHLAGDNSALVMEAAQILMDAPSEISQQALGPLEYIWKERQTSGVEGSLSRLHSQIQALQSCVCLLIRDLRSKVSEFSKNGVPPERIWTGKVQIAAVRTVQMLAWEFTHSAFVEVTEKAAEEKEILESVRNLFVLNILHANRSTLLRYRLITPLQAEDLSSVYMEAIASVKPVREALVDSFHLSDAELNSALARKGGKVYETLLQWAMEHNPLNSAPVFPGLKQLRTRL